MTNNLILIFIVLVILNLLDVITTVIAMSTGGKEMNPIARWALDKNGVKGLMIVKAISLLIILLLCVFAKDKAGSITAVQMLFIITILQGVVVLWNITNLLLFFSLNKTH